MVWGIYSECTRRDLSNEGVVCKWFVGGLGVVCRLKIWFSESVKDGDSIYRGVSVFHILTPVSVLLAPCFIINFRNNFIFKILHDVRIIHKCMIRIIQKVRIIHHVRILHICKIKNHTKCKINTKENFYLTNQWKNLTRSKNHTYFVRFLLQFVRILHK